nr:MAG TPA: hypothetical protein [Caudoviricetes sp.]DAK02347.1 MAG TPA: hypothetical protein [Caudoviricetes sp.]
MRVIAKRNIILPSPDGSLAYPLLKGYIGELPDWATKTAYFQACADSGWIDLPKSYKDRDVVPLLEKPVPRSTRKPKTTETGKE